MQKLIVLLYYKTLKIKYKKKLKKMENKALNVFRIPKSEKTVSSTLIGVLDSSGSMSSCWKYAAEFWNRISNN